MYKYWDSFLVCLLFSVFVCAFFYVVVVVLVHDGSPAFLLVTYTTDRWQSKTRSADLKSLETVLSIAICLRSSIVLTFSIAAYPV